MYVTGDASNESQEAAMKKATKVIRAITTCDSDEHRYLKGHRVRIVAVLKNAARPGIVDGPDSAHIDDDEELSRAGGITSDDRLEVTPWIEEHGRFSFVTSDPRAVDVALFAGLKEPSAGRKAARR
jgi:hypothetical protein